MQINDRYAGNMPTHFPPVNPNPEKPKPSRIKKFFKWAGIAFAALFVIGLIGSIIDPPEETKKAATQETATVEPVAEGAAEAPAPTAEPVVEPAIEPIAEEPVEEAPAAPGVDLALAPQEWWDEWYRSENCASQSALYGGTALCFARGVDTEKNGSMLVLYIDQDEPGMEEHFDMEARRLMFAQSVAGKVAGAKYEGDPRVQHVTDVRIIASGGGFFGGWQENVKVD